MADTEDIKNFKHSISEKVKFHEVDMMSICNNAVYFNYFEDARVKYLQDLKSRYKIKELMENGSFFIMVHNECDYHEPALFDDVLTIFTCVEFIKNTSFGFRHLVVRDKDNAVIASGRGALVHIDFNSRTKIPLPKEFYDAVTNLEENVSIIK